MDNSYEYHEGAFSVSSDRKRLDLNFVYSELSDMYWSKGMPRELLERSIQNSLCFGLYLEEKQIGFAKVVSDLATFAFLGDVFVSAQHRGKGGSKAIMRAIINHPDLQNLRRFCLGTKDAHDLYRKFGFEVIKEPSNWMEIKRPYNQ